MDHLERTRLANEDTAVVVSDDESIEVGARRRRVVMCRVMEKRSEWRVWRSGMDEEEGAADDGGEWKKWM